MSVYRGVTESNVRAIAVTADSVTATAATVTTATITNATVTALTAAGTITGNLDATAGYLQIPTAADTAIASAANAINTTNKAAGSVVFDTTNSKLKIATGGDVTSTWVDADGSNAVTPS